MSISMLAALISPNAVWGQTFRMADVGVERTCSTLRRHGGVLAVPLSCKPEPGSCSDEVESYECETLKNSI